MTRPLILLLDVKIPRWKRALLDACIWIINCVVKSIENNVEVRRG